MGNFLTRLKDAIILKHGEKYTATIKVNRKDLEHLIHNFNQLNTEIENQHVRAFYMVRGSIRTGYFSKKLIEHCQLDLPENEPSLEPLTGVAVPKEPALKRRCTTFIKLSMFDYVVSDNYDEAKTIVKLIRSGKYNLLIEGI